MILDLEIQHATQLQNIPSDSSFIQWSKAALRQEQDHAEMVIRLVDEAEIQELNRQYRGRDRPTNVLSFPMTTPAVVESNLLGDLVICAPVVLREAKEQGKPVNAHWAHMVVHGVLHLLGYDHQDESAGDAMEQLEQEIMLSLGFNDPYQEGEYE